MHTWSQHDKYIAVGLPKRIKKYTQYYRTAKNTLYYVSIYIMDYTWDHSWIQIPWEPCVFGPAHDEMIGSRLEHQWAPG